MTADTPITSVTFHASLRHPESTFNHYAPARAAASLPRRSLRLKSRRPRHARPGRRARMHRMPAPARAWMVRAVSPACADASHAGAGPGPASPGRNINPGYHSSPQGLRPDAPRTAEVEETYMARRGFDTESHDPPGSAVGKDSDEALHRIIQMMPFAGYSNLATEV
jgi:hypothetical protein